MGSGRPTPPNRDDGRPRPGSPLRDRARDGLLDSSIVIPSHPPDPSGNSPYPVRKGETVALRIERLAFGGHGVARVDGYAVFVPGGLPGQRVEAVILKRKRGYGEARLERVLEPGPSDVAPRCAHFGLCGGCRWQAEPGRGHVLLRGRRVE